jgi:hypothetical protein
MLRRQAFCQIVNFQFIPPKWWVGNAVGNENQFHDSKVGVRREIPFLRQ